MSRRVCIGAVCLMLVAGIAEASHPARFTGDAALRPATTPPRTSDDGRFELQSDLRRAGVVSDASGRFELSARFDAPDGTIGCAALDVIFRNGFDTQ